jgi:hypothetical protein
MRALHLLPLSSSSAFNSIKSETESNLYYGWRSVGQSFLVPGTNQGYATNFSIPFLKLLSDGFRSCWYGAPFLTKDRVYSLQLLLDLASTVFLGSVQQDSWSYFTVFICYSPNLEAQVPPDISPGNMVSHLYPRALGISLESKSMSKLSYDLRSVGQSVFVPGLHLGTATNLSSTSLETILRFAGISICCTLSDDRVGL